MAEDRNYESGGEGGGNERRFYARPKTCQFCADKTIAIDYKKVDMLKRLVTDEARSAPGGRPAHVPVIKGCWLARSNAPAILLCSRSRDPALKTIPVSIREKRGLHNSPAPQIFLFQELEYGKSA